MKFENLIQHFRSCRLQSTYKGQSGGVVRTDIHDTLTLTLPLTPVVKSRCFHEPSDIFERNWTCRKFK